MKFLINELQTNKQNLYYVSTIGYDRIHNSRINNRNEILRTLFEKKL